MCVYIRTQVCIYSVYVYSVYVYTFINSMYICVYVHVFTKITKLYKHYTSCFLSRVYIYISEIVSRAAQYLCNTNPFWQTFKLLPIFCYCKQCCGELTFCTRVQNKLIRIDHLKWHCWLRLCAFKIVVDIAILPFMKDVWIHPSTYNASESLSPCFLAK